MPFYGAAPEYLNWMACSCRIGDFTWADAPISSTGCMAIQGLWWPLVSLFPVILRCSMTAFSPVTSAPWQPRCTCMFAVPFIAGVFIGWYHSLSILMLYGGTHAVSEVPCIFCCCSLRRHLKWPFTVCCTTPRHWSLCFAHFVRILIVTSQNSEPFIFLGNLWRVCVLVDSTICIYMACVATSRLLPLSQHHLHCTPVSWSPSLMTDDWT